MRYRALAIAWLAAATLAGGRGIAAETPPLAVAAHWVVSDLSDKAAPVILRNVQYAGRYVSSRRIDGAVRAVISSPLSRLDVPTWVDVDYWEMSEGQARGAINQAYTRPRTIPITNPVSRYQGPRSSLMVGFHLGSSFVKRWPAG